MTDFLYPFDRYVDEVASDVDEKHHGKLERLAVLRHHADLAAGRFEFSRQLAARIVQFFGFLRHSKGEWAGSRFELEGWQQFNLGSLIGWIRPDGRRRYTRGYTQIARKNGKSTKAAGLGLYMLDCDGEPGAECYSASTKRDQSRIIHGEAVRMVEASPDLSRTIQKYRDILKAARHSTFEPLGADADTLDGLNVHFASCDEVHAWKNRLMWDVLDTATSARRSPLLYAITTAGYDDESICRELRDQGEDAVSGALDDPSFFAHIFEPDKNDDPFDPVTWGKGNPNLDVSVRREDLEEKAERAKRSPGYRNTFLRLHVDIWTQQRERWFPMELWKANAMRGRPTLEECRGMPAWAGLDLSSTLDLTAAAFAVPLEDRVALFWRHYIPRETAAEKQRRDRVPYLQWARDGWVFLTEGNEVDQEFVRRDVHRVAEILDVQEIAIDRWNASKLTTELGETDGFEVFGHGQGTASMNDPCKEFERLLVGTALLVGDDPCARWQAGNISLAQDPAGNVKPVKPNSKKSPKRIDGLVAAIMATGRARSSGFEAPAEGGIWLL